MQELYRMIRIPKKWTSRYLMVIAILLFNQLHAQNTTAIDSMFTSQYNNGLLMGNVLVADQGKIVYQHSFGYQDIDKKIPNTAASAFALASVSKQVTATAVLQLKEKGKLGLEDVFAKYFPDFPYPQITVRQLLNQTTGLPEYELFDSLAQKEPKRIFTNNDIIPALKLWKAGLYFKPGEDWRYSSMNYCLLAMLVEKASGEQFANYIERHIFSPAGIKHTYIENYLLKVPNPYRTINYEIYFTDSIVPVDSVEGDHEMIYNMGGFYGQGGLTSTADDLLRFDDAFFAGKLISKADIDDALQPAKLNNGATADTHDHGFGSFGKCGYGLGWFIVLDSSKGKIVWHDGGRPGISTVHLHNVATNQTVIVLENSPHDTRTPAITAYQLLNNMAVTPQKLSLIAPYAHALVKEGAEAAFTRFNTLRDDPHYEIPTDYTWVQLGYELYDKPEHAMLQVEVFKVGCLLFPSSWYVTQGYAAALSRIGKIKEAIMMYKKSLLQNPQNDFAKEQLKVLEK